MKKITISAIKLLLIGFFSIQFHAQTASTSDNMVARPAADRTVPFGMADPGISKTVEFGADLAWANEQAFRRNVLFMGLNQIDIVRASFQPTYPLVNGTDLTQEQINDLNYRVGLINTYVGPNTRLTLNCDHPWVDAWYVGQPSRWHQLIKTTAQKFKDAGHTIVTVGAFNEPDYGWGQGSNQDMYNITSLLKNDSFFNGVRLSGGNTLNNDAAQGWYDYLIPAGVNEGNTHQLAGSFDGYASFLQNVRANGHYAMLDELHNIGEALVGYEYGMQGGIWWADIDLASGEMVKAFDGQRLAYAEHRPNWTSAAVYRSPEGKIQAFGGTSERQAVTTTFNFISKDKAVYFDGQGPFREFVLEMPGGAVGSYMNGQTNAERVINITSGEDIQPVINGRYILVNRNSGQVMGVNGSGDGANVQQVTYSGALTQQWDVTPVDSRIGGDFSYFRINPAADSTKSLDLYGFSLDNGGNIDQWTTGLYGNNQWYLDYAEDGWFYIRSRESSKCAIVDATNNVVQWDKNGGYEQQWRLLPVGTPIEFTAPTAPSNLVATAQPVSIKLDWTASASSDIAGYTILRSESANGVYNTIARKVTTTSFVDNTVLTGTQYFYKIRAVDNSLNRSVYSNQVSATAIGANAIVAQYKFDGNTSDATINLNKGAVYGTTTYVAGKEGSNALSLDGANNFVQLPADIANHQQITVAAWVYYRGGAKWQRVFDFGNGTDEYMFLTPNSWTDGIQFGLKYNGTEQSLYGPAVSVGQWTHIAVTLGANGGKLYVNGQLVDSNANITIRPRDFKPVLNYIGRSQYPDPKLNANIDDFRIYNYALPGIEINKLANSYTYFQLQNRATGLFVDGMGRTNNGDDAGQWAASSSDNSKWELINIEGDYYQVKNKATGMFLDGMGRTTNGNACGQWANATSYNSQWQMIDVGGNFYQMKNRATGLLLDGLGATANGSAVNQWANTTSYNSHWGLVGVVTLPTATSLHVQSIVIGSANAGQGKKRATAQVTILDNNSVPVSGATVNATFSGTFNETVSGVTGANGVVTLQTVGSAKGTLTVNICINNVTYSGLTYNAAQNVVTCTSGTAKIGDLSSDNLDSNVEFSVYPNPTSAYVTISLGEEITSAAIVDMNGRSMQAQITKLAEGSYQVDMTNLSSGVYLLVIDTPESQLSKKIIKE